MSGYCLFCVIVYGFQDGVDQEFCLRWYRLRWAQHWMRIIGIAFFEHLYWTIDSVLFHDISLHAVESGDHRSC